MKLEELKNQSMKLRKEYHKLEEKYHKSVWSIEEDALAFLTDAGIVGRLTMANQGRWSASNNEYKLDEKIGECVWWLAVLAERMDLDFEECIKIFFDSKKDMLNE